MDTKKPLTGNVKGLMLLKQFLVGLPSQYASQLRLSMAASSSGLTVSAVATQARALSASGLVQTSEMAAVASQSASLVCYQGQLTGHLRKDCPQNASGGARKKTSCYRCNQVGHLRRNCPQRIKGSETTDSGSVQAQFFKGSASGGTTAVASAESKGSGFCLALSARTGVSLPRIKVHVRGCAVPLRLAVDSCSHRSLIALEVTHKHDISILQVAADYQPITAIDGNVQCC